MSVFGSGIRPWKRQTETKRAADSSVPGKGELVVSDAGKVYAGDGATQAKNLSPMLRKTDADTTYATTSQGAKADSAVQPAALSSGLAGKANTTHAHTPGDITALTEYIQDAVNDLIQAGANVTKSYDDAANTLTIAATGGGGGGTDAEVVRDTIAGALVASTGINIAVDDGADTITISVAGIPASAITTGTLPISRGGTGGTDAASARAALGAGTSSLTLGTTGSTAAAGNDARLSNTRTPTDGSVTTAKVADGAIVRAKLGSDVGRSLPKNASYYGVSTANTGAQNSTAIAAAIAACSSGDTLVFPGEAGATIEIASPITLKPRVRYVFSSGYGMTEGVVVKAASGFSGKAMIQSAVLASTSQTVCDEPVVVEAPTLHGNKSVNTSGTYVGIALCGYWSQITDPYVHDMPSHDILLTDKRWDGGVVTNSCSENQIIRPKLDGSNGDPVKVESWNGASNMDGHLLDGWLSNFAGNGIEMDRAAGWTIRNNHLYGVGKTAIALHKCYATKVTHNYVEDFGAENAAGGYYAGISADLLDHWSTDISHNFVGQNVFTTDNAARRASYQLGAAWGQSDAKAILRGNSTYCGGGSSVQYPYWWDVASGGKLTVDVDRVATQGTWVQAGYVNTADVTVSALTDRVSPETAYASSTVTETLATSAADIPGLLCTVPLSDRPQMLEWFTAGFYGNNTGTIIYQIVRQSDLAIVAKGMLNTSTSEGYKVPGPLRYRIPSNTASDTYRCQAWRSAGAAACQINPWAVTGFIQAVEV